MQNKADNTLGIISIICGGLGFVLSLVPCVGVIGIPLGIIGLILGAIAFMKAKDNGHPKTLAYIGLVLSLLPIIITLMYYFTFTSATNSAKSDVKTYTSCDSLMIDIQELRLEIRAFEEENQNVEGMEALKQVSKITKLAIKLNEMENQARNLNCDDPERDSYLDSLGVDKEIEVDSLGEGWDF